MRQIRLVNQNLYVLVDDVDYDFLNQFRWYLLDNGHGNYYANTEISPHQFILMHQLLVPNVPKGHNIDHENHNGLDNQRDNLHILTIQQNNLHKKVQRKKYSAGKKSIYKGVYHERRTDKWFASITVKGKSKNLGTYINEIDAAKAYNVAAQKYFGEFASLNTFEI